MPSTPVANASQKELLNRMKDLAQTDAANSTNQIASLNQQISNYQDGRTLFSDRYAYWSKFITDYELERKYLDGQYIASPVGTSDFTDFQNQTGRLFDANAPAPDRFTPKRISEFEGGNRAYSASFDEATHHTEEGLRRSLLLSGFSTPGFPSGLTTLGPVAQAATSIVVTANSAQSIPTGGRVLILGPSSSCVGIVTSVEDNSNPQQEQYIYSLGLTLETPTFTTVSPGATLYGSLTAFTNTERTNKLASSQNRQDALNGLIAKYASAITNWKSNLENQRSAILAQTNEDAPDSSYVSQQLSDYTTLVNYLTTTQVSDTALSAMASLNTSRASARSARVSWIATRMTATDAYTERHKYADRLFNLTDGIDTTISVIEKQRDAVVAQQANSNTRAAKFTAEEF